MKGKYLITTDNWFYARDGKQYNAVWGQVEIVDDSVLGIKTNARSSNWYAKVGVEHKHVIVAGCQIHYATKCETTPNTNEIVDHRVTDNGCLNYTRPCQIYIAE